MAVRAQITSEDRVAGGKRIEGSLRFDGSHSDHLKRSFGIADGTKKTFSFCCIVGKEFRKVSIQRPTMFLYILKQN